MRADNRGEGGILALTALALRTTEPRAALLWLDPRRRPGRRLAVLRRRRHHPGDLGAERGRRAQGRDAALRALRPSDHRRRCCSGSSCVQRRGTGAGRRVLRPGHGALVRRHRPCSALIEIVQQPAHPAGAQPLLRHRPISPTIRGSGFVAAGRGGAGGDRRRGALRRYGPFRPRGRSASPGSASSSRRCCSIISARARCCCADPSALENPFYRLAPDWALYPAGGAGLGGDRHRLAGGDLRRLLDDAPGGAARLSAAPRRSATPPSRRSARSTCRRSICFLLVAVVALVLGFRSSDNLGAAYGIAVTGTMTLTTVLALVYMYGVRRWQPGAAARAVRLLPDRRPRLLRRQYAQDRRGRLVPAGRRRASSIR